MKKTTRREFVRTSVAAGVVAAGAIAAPTVIAGNRQGRQRAMGVGFIGTGGRCGAHLKIVNDFKQQGIAEPVAVCDVYRPRLEAASKKHRRSQDVRRARGAAGRSRMSTWSALPPPTAFTGRRPSTP